jgi:hypothetical protein
LAFSPGDEDPLGGHAQRLHGGAVLHRIGGCGDQLGAGADLLAPGPPPQGGAQRLGGGDNQGLELAAGVGPGGHDGAAGGVQHPDCFSVAALAGAGEVVAGQGFAAGPDGVQGVALGPVAAAGSLGSVDLDHPLALVGQKPGQPGPIAARPFQGPDPPARGLRVGQLEQPGMAGLVAWHLQGGPHPSVGIQEGRGVGVAVGVDPDDGVNLAL